MLLFRGPHWDRGLSTDELQQAMNKVMAWFEGLNERGKIKGAQPLGGQGRVISGTDGRFQVLLPQDGYGITATKAVTENGNSVTYRGATSLTLDTDSNVAISLAKVVSRSVTMSWDSSQRREIAAGDSVVYTIVVSNTGNVGDTFRLDGTPADWQFTFSPSSR